MQLHDFKSKMERELEKIARDQDFFREIKLEKSLETKAKISLVDHRIIIRYYPEFINRIWDKKTQLYLMKKNIPKDKVLEQLVRSLLLHELGHRGLASQNYKGCPRDAKTLSEKFLDVISKITKEKNKKVLSYFSNAITDIINDTTLKKINNKEGVDTLTASILYFKEQGLLSKGKFSKFYEAFVRLNLYFWGDKYDMELLREYFTFDEEINEAIKNFLDKTGISEMKEELYQGSKKIKVRNREEIRNYLMNPDNWKKICKVFTEEFWKFMKQKPPRESLFGAGGRGFGHKHDFRYESPSSSNDSGDDSGEPDNFPNGDGFGEELNDDATKKGLIKIKDKSGSGPGWMTNFEYLRLLYEILASDKLFELRNPSFNNRTYEIIPFGERVFDLINDSPTDIEGIGFDRDTKNLELMVSKYKLPLIIDVKKEFTDKPAVFFALFDTSGSMRESISDKVPLGGVVNPEAPEEQQWRWNSKYHISLIAYIMIKKLVEEFNVKDQNVFFVNFSEDTILSTGLEDSLKEAFHPQFGGTKIILDKIKVLTSLKGALIISLSDGDIDNWVEVFNIMKEVNKENTYIQIQMGKHSKYSKKLLENNMIVKQIMNEEDLYHFVIDITTEYYTKYNNKLKVIS